MKKMSVMIILMMILIMLAGSVPVSAKQKKPKIPNQIIEWVISTVDGFVERYKRNRDLLANVIYYENWHTDPDKKTARWTGAVVLNRVKSPKFPNTIEGVLYQKNPVQYSTTSYFFTKELPQEVYDMADELLLNGAPEVPDNVVYQATFKQGSGVWKELNGEVFCYG